MSSPASSTSPAKTEYKPQTLDKQRKSRSFNDYGISAAIGSDGKLVYNIGAMEERSTPQKINGSSAAGSGAQRGNASDFRKMPTSERGSRADNGSGLRGLTASDNSILSFDGNVKTSRDTAGEIEARDVTNRRALTPEERKNKAPDLGDENTVFAEDGVSYSDESVIDLSDDSKLARLIATSDNSKYNTIRNYVFELLGGRKLTLSDGRIVVIDKTDAKELAHKANDRKTAEIASIEKIIQEARYFADDSAVTHDKFDYFAYYFAPVRYKGKVYNVIVNAGRAKNDGVFHLYDLTNDIKNKRIAGRISGLSGPVGNRITNDSYNATILSSEENVNRQYSVSERTPEQKKEILAQARRYAAGEISKGEFFNYVDGIDGTKSGRSSAMRRQNDGYSRRSNMQGYSDEAREIYDRAHSEGVSVDEYLRRNWEEFDVDGRWNDAAQEALRMDGRRYSVSVETAEAVKSVQGMDRKSINSFTSEDIEKTRPFAAKYWHEMGTKSPFFRAWFGDWRANDKSKAAVVNAGGGSFKAGKAVNKDTGTTLSWGDVLKKETITHQPLGGVASHALGAIEDIAENAVLLDTYTSSLTSKTKLPGTAFMHSYYTVVNYEGTNYLLKLFAEEAVSLKSGEIFTRAYELKDIKKVAALPDGVLSESRGLTDGNTSTALTVADIVSLVNKYDKSYNPKPASKVVNEDGTPMVVYHGTDDTFWKFDTNKIRDREGSFFFAQNREDAAAYSGSGRIMEAYVNLQNPIDYNCCYVGDPP